MPIKHILFPVDFSERCEDAVPFVEAMARSCDAKVTLLAAAEIHFAGAAEGSILIDPQEILRETAKRLDEWQPKQFQGIPANRIAQLGDPTALIADFVKANQVDLIMMPTHGYGPFRQLLLGSVTAKVLHDVGCPVWPTAHTHEDQDPQHASTRKIICAIDSGAESIALLRWAGNLAKKLNATLRVVHAIPGMEAWPERQLDVEFEAQMRESARQRILAMEKSADIDVQVCVGSGSVANVVAEEARQHRANLVIIGRGAASQTFGRLRTHAFGIIRHSPCPVLSV